MDVKRQQKITNLFGKPPPKQHDSGAEERINELLESNKRLKKLLIDREAYAFQLQRSLLPQPRPFQAKHQAAISSEISSLGGEAMMRSKLAKQRERLETYLRLFGVQVKVYTDEICIVVYNVRIKGELVAQYGIQFTKPADGQDWSVFKYHLPVGLSLEILSGYQEMSLEYLRQLHIALWAYHERKAQISKLKESIPSHVYVTHNMSGTVVELVFPMIEKNGTGRPIKTALELKYDPFQKRPKELKIVQNLVLQYSEEFEAALSSQFEIMKYHSLPEGFTSAVSQDGENNFYCPSEEEHDNQDAGFEEQVYTGPVQTRNEAVARRGDSVESEEEIAVPQTKKSHKKRTKQPNHPKSQHLNDRQMQPERSEELESVSDDESVSFTTLRRQMKEMKQQGAFKKPSAPKTVSKRSTPRNEVEQYDDDTDSYTTEALKEPNKKRRDSSNSRISTYQVTDNDLTTGSYVFIPESKKKAVKTSTAKKSKGNVSVGKENGKKTKATKGKSKK